MAVEPMRYPGDASLSVLEHRMEGGAIRITVELTVTSLCLFEPVLRLFVRRAGEPHHVAGLDSYQSGLFYPWLPRGVYRFELSAQLPLAPGRYEAGLSWGTPSLLRDPDFLADWEVAEPAGATAVQGGWHPDADSAARIQALSWQKGMDNWFHRHFCHAADVIAKTFLKESPNLRGRILDIGAGDGITDLGIVLRYAPQELVAVDIVDFLLKLPEVARDNDLPLERIPDNVTFVQGSSNHLDYPDASFDLVLSWGSVEHIAGGYRDTLDEVWRC